ncbi:MAG TPA: hypothetical protein VKA41_10345, partial [Solirubrobacterales bacterium]|nr:hypothetical protein [Solirubrobacterales bacterium]
MPLRRIETPAIKVEDRWTLMPLRLSPASVAADRDIDGPVVRRKHPPECCRAAMADGHPFDEPSHAYRV